MEPKLLIFTESMDDILPSFEDETRFSMDYPEFAFFTQPQNSEEHESPQEISTLKGYEGIPLIKQHLSKKQLGFNILLLALLSIAAGWFGILLKSLTGQTNLALSVFLALPPMGVLVLNLVYKNSDINPGFGMNLRKNGVSYIFSLILIPALVTVIVWVGKSIGVISIDGIVNQGVGKLFGAVMLLFFSDFIKNCLEEFTWRGFFTQHFKKLGLPDLANHFVTGIIWSLWHLPYWLFLLDKTTRSAVSTLDTPLFVLMGILFLLALSFVFGELRLLSKSAWPVVLLHTSLNAITITLLLNGFVKVKSSAELWLSPGGNSIMFISLLILVGLALYRARTKKSRVAS